MPLANALAMPLWRYLEAVHTIPGDNQRGRRFEWFPDGRTALVIRVFEPGQSGDVAVLGPRTRTLFKNPKPSGRALVLEFKPGWSASLLGVGARALTDQVVPLEELWGSLGSELSAQLVSARTQRQALENLSSAIALRFETGTESSHARLARRAARLLQEEPIGVGEAAQQLGVSARHLRRAFAESIGIGPKLFARGARLRRAVRLASSSHSWAQVAADAGYYDQAHLIADFRALSGLTPSAFFRLREERTHETVS